MNPTLHPDQERGLAAIPPPITQYRKPPLTLGRLAYLCYYAPKGALQKGPLKIYRGWRGKRRVAKRLHTWEFPAPLSGDSQPPQKLHVLIGARYLAEACLLSHSLAQSLRSAVAPVFYDDGTLTDEDYNFLSSKLPLAQFRRQPEIAAQLDKQLPEDRFPALRRLRPAYPHIRKLTDIHLFETESWKLVSDADILFFARPNFLFEHLTGKRPFHMVDIAPAYGVPQMDLERLAGCQVHPTVNVGLCHLETSAIDWEFVEYCAIDLLARHGFTYYLEQALTAVLLARMGAVPLPKEDYVVYPDFATARAAQAAALHYVDDSRAYYYDFAWQQVMERQL